jgi:hypothetical protein
MRLLLELRNKFKTLQFILQFTGINNRLRIHRLKVDPLRIHIIHRLQLELNLIPSLYRDNNLIKEEVMINEFPKKGFVVFGNYKIRSYSVAGRGKGF